MHRKITASTLVRITTCLLLSSTCFAASDSSVSHAKNGSSVRAITRSDSLILTNDSLAIDSLLKAIDSVVYHDAFLKTNRPLSKSPRITSVSKEHGTTKHQVSMVNTNDSLSFAKRVSISFPGIAFVKKYFATLFFFLFSLCLILLTITYFFLKNDKDRFISATRLSIMDKEIQRACSYIEKNYADPGLSIDKICSELVTGEAFLQALFRKELGISVDTMIKHVRVNRVRNIMKKDTSINAEMLSSLCGFTNVEMLNCIFNEITGEAFEEYRAKLVKQV